MIRDLLAPLMNDTLGDSYLMESALMDILIFFVTYSSLLTSVYNRTLILKPKIAE